MHIGIDAFAIPMASVKDCPALEGSTVWGYCELDAKADRSYRISAGAAQLDGKNQIGAAADTGHHQHHSAEMDPVHTQPMA